MEISVGEVAKRSGVKVSALHFYEQKALGPYYLSLQGISAGLFSLTGKASKPIFDCTPFITTTYSDLRISGC